MQDVKDNFIISRIYGAIYEVYHPEHGFCNAVLRGKLRLAKNRERHPFVVGDRVTALWEQNELVIAERLPRKSFLVRQNSFKEAHVLCANIDYLLILASLAMPESKDSFIDRCLASCYHSGITPLIVFNKQDLVASEVAEKKVDKYSNLGYKVFLISSLAKESMQQLLLGLSNKVTYLVGNSGVGKSTFLNQVVGEKGGNVQKTNDVSGSTQKGRHTTTNSRALFLAQGVVLIDSPGVKEWGLLHMQPVEVLHSFPELQGLRGDCAVPTCCDASKKCKMLKNYKRIDLSEDRQKSLDAILYTLENPGKEKPGQYSHKGKTRRQTR
ncbi:MAG: ribosome small subunit-dependent GTPase A [Spirochaetota bacterium]